MSVRRPSARQWNVILRHDPENDCLSLAFRDCALQTREDVISFFAECYARVRTFELPSDLIVEYAGLSVAPDMLHFFVGARAQWSARVGGRIQRFARGEEDKRFLASTTTEGTTTHDTYAAAAARLRADRARILRETA